MKLESQDATQQVPERVPSQSIQPGSGRQRLLNAKSIHALATARPPCSVPAHSTGNRRTSDS